MTHEDRVYSSFQKHGLSGDGVEELAINTSELNNAQQEVKDMMSRMKLIEEDIKGAAVDNLL